MCIRDRYREVGMVDWIEEITSELSFAISGLMDCTEYEFQVQPDCESVSPDFTESISLFISNCDDPCLEIPYCEIAGYNSTEEFINRFVLNDLDNESGNDGGYGDYTMDFAPTIMQGGIYEITLEPIWVGNTFVESFAVWVDGNHDGVLDESEKVLSVDGVTDVYKEVITIPSDTELGNTRVRVGMRFNAQPPNCTPDNFIAFGETEDYCFTVTEFMCTPSQIIDTTFTSTDEIGLSFEQNFNVDDIFISYKKVSDVDWVEEAIIGFEYVASGLEECSEYEFRTRTQCGPGFTDYTEPVIFATQCVSSIEDFENSLVTVYPNPFNDVLTISKQATEFSSFSYEIYSQLGTVVQKASLSNVENQQITLNALSSGIYYIRILGESETISYRKIVKM